MTSRDPLRELEDALSFPTSPDFSARVRQQVAIEPRRARPIGRTSLALAAAVVLASGIAAVTRPVARPGNVARPGFEGREVYVARPGLEGREVYVARPGFEGREHRESRVTTAAFETLVPDDQRRALEVLLASMREGRGTVPPSAVEEEVGEHGERRLRALVIEPMKIEPLPGAAGETNKDPVKDPIK